MLIPLLAAGVQIALVVAAWGMMSLLLDRDVIDDPAMGPLAGPIATAASAIVVAIALRRALITGRPALAAIAAAAGALLVMAGVIGIAAVIAHGDAAWVLLGAASVLAAPFVPAAALLAGLSIVAGWALARASRYDSR